MKKVYGYCTQEICVDLSIQNGCGNFISKKRMLRIMPEIFSYLCIQFHCPHSYSGNCRGCSHTRPSDRADAGTHWCPPHRMAHSNLTSTETKHSYHKLYMKKNEILAPPSPLNSVLNSDPYKKSARIWGQILRIEESWWGWGVWLFNAQ